jgi:uncharacterized phage protein (TIGR02216 family)
MTPDWPAILATCARCGVSPAAAWQLSIREWRALTGDSQTRPLDAAGLAGLMARFPDHPRPEIAA